MKIIVLLLIDANIFPLSAQDKHGTMLILTKILRTPLSQSQK